MAPVTLAPIFRDTKTQIQQEPQVFPPEYLSAKLEVLAALKQSFTQIEYDEATAENNIIVGGKLSIATWNTGKSTHKSESTPVPFMVTLHDIPDEEREFFLTRFAGKEGRATTTYKTGRFFSPTYPDLQTIVLAQYDDKTGMLIDLTLIDSFQCSLVQLEVITNAARQSTQEYARAVESVTADVSNATSTLFSLPPRRYLKDINAPQKSGEACVVTYNESDCLLYVAHRVWGDNNRISEQKTVQSELHYKEDRDERPTVWQYLFVSPYEASAEKLTQTPVSPKEAQKQITSLIRIKDLL